MSLVVPVSVSLWWALLFTLLCAFHLPLVDAVFSGVQAALNRL